MLPALRARAGASAILTSAIFAAFSIGLVAGFGLAGSVTRRWGPRLTLLLGAAAHVGADVLYVTGHGAGSYTAARLLQGLGSGGMWLGAILAALTWWPERPGPRMGAVLTSYAVGAVAGPLLSALGGAVRPFLAEGALGVVAVASALRLPSGPGRAFGWHLPALRDRRLLFASSVVLLAALTYSSIEGSFTLRFASRLSQGGLGALVSMVALVSGLGAMLPFATRGPREGRVVAQAGALATGGLLLAVSAVGSPLAWFVLLGLVGLCLGASESGALGLVASVPEGGMLTAQVAYAQVWAFGFLIGPPGATWLATTSGHLAPGIGLAAVGAGAAALGALMLRGREDRNLGPGGSTLPADRSDRYERAGGPMVRADATLRGIPEIRRFFRTNETPVYFVSATAFNLLGIDRWVRNFRYLNYYDSFDGHHPNVFVPRERSDRAFESIEEICNYLLGHKEVADFVAARSDRPGGRGKAAFLMFDEETEELAGELGLDVAFPSAALRNRLDSKIETTRLGNEAGVPSAPNVLGRATGYAELLDLAGTGGLGSDLVVQTPYGDSGQTTFFIASAGDWDECEEKLVGEELKVMKRINCREAAMEGVVTRHGTLVGPLMTELTGFPELTPYGGGWCGNDVFPSALSAHADLARARMKAMGDRLAAEGYRGYFELDFLADEDSGEMYLGELNPRVTGASSMTNVTAIAYGDMPLFLFHLLEFMDVDYEIDVEELNARWARAENVDAWSQFILKQTDDAVEVITEAPASGVWRMGDDEAISFLRRETDWHSVADEREAFYLRIASAGQYRYPGADLGILVTRGRLMDDEHELTDRARTWISGIKAQFVSVPPPPATPVPQPEPFGFKLL